MYPTVRNTVAGSPCFASRGMAVTALSRYPSSNVIATVRGRSAPPNDFVAELIKRDNPKMLGEKSEMSVQLIRRATETNLGWYEFHGRDTVVCDDRRPPIFHQSAPQSEES